jgi:aryl-alcohol dehydrogenase-like predicted oxidoreductase
LVDLIREVATDHGATPAQVALAWVLARGADVAPIFGTTRPERLIENLAALDLVLDATAMARLDAALSERPVIGDRYAPEGMKGLGG